LKSANTNIQRGCRKAALFDYRLRIMDEWWEVMKGENGLILQV